MESKVAAITGGYKGLGAALSKALAGKGYKLVVGGRNKEELDKFVSSLAGKTEAIGVEMDVRRKKDCQKFINAAVEKFGRLDLLINNAGVWKKSAFEEITESEMKDTFETNAFGPMYCAQFAVAVMKKQGSGHILNIGSTAAVDHTTRNIAYGASKAALIGFTGCLVRELQGTGVRVSVFSPGGMKTDIFKHSPEIFKEDFYKNAMSPEFVADKILAHIENPGDEWHVVLHSPKS